MIERNGNIYVPIDVEYFLDCTLPRRTCEKKAIPLNNYRLKTVREVVQYWGRNVHRITRLKNELPPNIWEYWNCLEYGFRQDVLDTDRHKECGGEPIATEEREKILTADYYRSKTKMSDEEIKKFLEDNPVDFEPHLIRHATHRAYAMIGRLIRNEPYIPFYVNLENLYCRPHCDGYRNTSPFKGEIIGHKHAYPPISRLKYLDELEKSNIPKKEYTICQSGWLALMGIRANDDIDIVISSRLRQQKQNRPGHLNLPAHIEIFSENHPKFRQFGCKNDDDLVYNYSIRIDGYNFCQPRFYFSRLWPDNESKIIDREKIKLFDKNKSWQMYPFSEITKDQWGFHLLPPGKKEDKIIIDLDRKEYITRNDKRYKILLPDEIDFKRLKLLYRRKVFYLGQDHSRKIYYDRRRQLFVKYWDEDYIRGSNFLAGLNAGFYGDEDTNNGSGTLIPHLYGIIFDKNKTCRGYVTHQAEDVPAVPGKFKDEIKERIKNTGYFYYDFDLSNIKKFRGSYCLLDLESVYPVCTAGHLADYHCELKPADLLD